MSLAKHVLGVDNVIDHPHTLYIDDHIVALVEYRLYKSGPGPEPIWFYRDRAGFRHAVESPDDLPLVDMVEWWGEHPETDERVLFQLSMAAPPRHGKSFVVTEWTPPWFAAKYPGNDIMFATYSDDFASEWGEALRDVFVDSMKAFGLELQNGRKANSNKFRLSYQASAGLRKLRMRMTLVGTGGSSTGKGYQLGIIDDLFKDNVDAMSTATRNTKDGWAGSTFFTRKTRLKGKRIPVTVMMYTRWHKDDVAGRRCFNEDGSHKDDWFVLVLPAIAREDDPLGREPGEALAPSIKTVAELQKIQEADPYWFSCMYQGSPVSELGGVFPNQFSHYRLDPEGVIHAKTRDGLPLNVSPEECMRFASVDVAATKKSYSDWSVYSVWLWHRETKRLFLQSMIRERVLSSDHLEWLRKCYEQLPAPAIYVEDRTFGTTLIQATYATDLPVFPVKAVGDKVERATPYAQACTRGDVFFPGDAEWLNLWEQEHREFMAGGDHDDMVDTGAYAYRRGLIMMPPPPPKKEPTTPAEKLEAHLDRKYPNVPRNGRGLTNRQRIASALS